jgi:hypothetical protein
MNNKQKTRIPKDLQAVFDHARKQLDALPYWRITHETRKEIKRMLNNIKAAEENLKKY